jgi:hypothetical protein
MARPKRPADFAQRAKLIVDMLTGQAPNDSAVQKEGKFVKSARKGGRKGGTARAKKLTAEQRAEIAKTAAAARWKKSR